MHRPFYGASPRCQKFNVVVLALLLNYPWYFVQVPLFEQMPTQRTGGDQDLHAGRFRRRGHHAAGLLAGIGSRSQPVLDMRYAAGFEPDVVRPGRRRDRVAGTERLWIDGCRYSALMPVLPGVGVELSPALQWILLPALTAWFVRRQMSGLRGAGQ